MAVDPNFERIFGHFVEKYLSDYPPLDNTTYDKLTSDEKFKKLNTAEKMHDYYVENYLNPRKSTPRDSTPIPFSDVKKEAMTEDTKPYVVNKISRSNSKSSEPSISSSVSSSKDSRRKTKKHSEIVYSQYAKFIGLNRRGKKTLKRDPTIKSLLEKPDTDVNELLNSGIEIDPKLLRSPNDRTIFHSLIDNIEIGRPLNVRRVEKAVMNSFKGYEVTFESTLFGKIREKEIRKWQTLGSNNDCLIHSFLTVTSETYRRLPTVSKIHASNEFRRITLPKIIELQHELVKTILNTQDKITAMINLLLSTEFLDDTIIGILASIFGIRVVVFQENIPLFPRLSVTQLNETAKNTFFIYNNSNVHFSAVSLFDTEDIWTIQLKPDYDDPLILEMIQKTWINIQ